MIDKQHRWSAVQRVDRVIKPGLFLLCLLPFALLLWDLARDALGANPIEEITHRTGDWTLRLLLVTLAITPIRRLTGFNPAIRVRRMLGLFAFFYASLHFSTYLVLDQFFALDAIVDDVAKRPYITVGVTSFLLLVPLALTSTKGWVRRLGGKTWNAVHRLVYVAAAGGVLHYLWLIKGDQPTPVYYAAVLIALLAVRVWAARFPRRAGTPSRHTPAPPTAEGLASIPRSRA